MVITRKNVIGFLGIFVVVSLIAGCAWEPPKTPPKSGFLKNYNQMQKMPNGALFYEKPGLNWSKYSAVIIMPVHIHQLKDDANRRMSRRDRLKLAIYFEYAMRASVQQKYKVVQEKGPNVLVVRAAITNVNSEASMASNLAIASPEDFGSVWMEGEIVDSMTHERLIAIVDGKAGELFASYDTWDDVTGAFDKWGAQLYGILKQKLGDVKFAPDKAKPFNQNQVAATSNYNITLLLQRAGSHMQANRLTTPEGKNALENYQQVLERDPNNAQALKGLDRITAKYVAWGEYAIGQGDRPKAERYLNSAQSVLSDDPGVARLSAKLAGADQVTQPAPARVVTQPKKIAKPKRVVVAPKAESDWSAEPAPVVTKPKVVAVVKPRAQPKPKPAPKPAPVVVAPKPKKAAFDPWANASLGNAAFQSDNLRPFMLGLETSGNLGAIAKAAKKRLTNAGFKIVGEYKPVASTQVIVVTSDALKSTASKTEYGVYGAAIRVALTTVGGKVQIAYTNPIYMFNVYRMKGNLSQVANKLGKALGQQRAFGSKNGISPSDLRDWHYMFGMPYFDDQDELASSGNYNEAVKKIEAGLAAGKGGVKKVYRIDIPGKNETIFGVSINNGAAADKKIMDSIDDKTVSHSAHLPYELIVSGENAYAFSGKFRIALSFPDLTMGQFMGISTAPDAIKSALESVAANN